MSKRIPEARLLAKRANDNLLAEKALLKPVKKNEFFDQQSQTRGTQNKLYSLHLGDAVPLSTRPIADWPSTTSALCLHCAEKCPSTPYPAVKYYDSQEQKYWVYGYFCRPCCVLSYVQDLPHTDSTRCLMWTQTILRRYFDINSFNFAPPRSALKKFGGQMDLNEFYGESGNCKFKELHVPPFVTFAMYAEVTQNKDELFSTSEDKKLNGLRRPLQRTTPTATQESTEKTPLILEFLAKKGQSSITQLKSIEHKEIAPEPKRNKSSTLKAVIPQPKAAMSGGLSKYIVKGK